MKSFSAKRIVRDDSGGVIGVRQTPAVRATDGELGKHHGPDSGKKLIVSLIQGDLIRLRPWRTQRYKEVSAFDVYDWIITREAFNNVAVKKRAAKERRAQRLADARQKRAEKRFTRPL